MKIITLLSCIDGRFQVPLTEYLLNKYNGYIVDKITFPGMDKIFSHDFKNEQAFIKGSIDISFSRGSKSIYIMGHSDCTGNILSDELHIIEVKNSVKALKKEYKGAKVIGLFIDLDYNVIEIE